uniref:receptor protein-tyrosine kinase n=1 Tax=Pygocentrus nattereri TaxID=42514 RepID=A0A3B4EHP9_PYGNA
MWKETSGNLQEFPDSGQFCQKKILFFKACSEVNNHNVQCCLTNLDGSYCSEPITVKSCTFMFHMYTYLYDEVLIHLYLIMTSHWKVYTMTMLCCSPLGLLRLHGTDMGPSDNDYIYIDFRDFKYDQKWEFPRENLELGKVLGSGAFGMVVQATAYGISKPGVSMQVAVKMLKDKHQAVEKEALMSELKMLTHLGHHTNIVNLLGACTGTGPIYLIFQYCCHGDLLNYLKNRRENFYKSLADAFNKDRFSGLYQNYQRKRNSSEFTQSDDISYMHMSPVTKEREDEDMQTLTYDDLLSFSYQVAKGMEFLSYKNCIHRDLAARNILVTQGRLVKIGDFGLSRDIENDSNYVVRGNARLPVKWMAPESIFKGTYTMQSDVWAYGILLWEIFSLGVTPYPGIKVDNNFYVMIERGFQMERPYYASESVYNVMCRCWALESRDRPCFSKLVAFMEYQLTDVEEQVIPSSTVCKRPEFVCYFGLRNLILHHVFLQLYYNVGGQKNSDSVYKNAPVILQRAETVEEEVVCQSALTDSSCKTEIVEEDPDTKDETVETETCI